MANGQDEPIDFSAPEFQASPQETAVQQGETIDFSAPEMQAGAEDDPSFLGGLARSFFQGLTFRFGDEAESIARNALATVGLPVDRMSAEEIQSEIDRFAQDNQGAAILSEVVGALVVPGSIAARGAVRAGQALRNVGATRTANVLTSTSMPARIVRGAGAGGASAGVAGAGGAQGGVGERLEAGVESVPAGLAFGAAAPVAVQAAIRGGQAALRGAQRAGAPIRRMVDPQGEAALRVARAREQDIALGEPGLGVPIGPAGAARTSQASQQAFQRVQAEGVPVANIDLGGRVTRRLARAAANQSPEAGAVLERLVQDRFQGQGARTEQFISDLFTGGRQDSFTLRDQLRTAARRANRPAYERAYAAGDRSLRSPELERLLSADAVAGALQNAVRRGSNRVVAEGGGEFNPRVTISDTGQLQFARSPQGRRIFPNLRLWDLTKRELDDAASAAARAGRDEEAGAIRALASDLRAELDQLVPSYATARGTAQSFFQAGDALEAGQNFARQSRFSIPEARQALNNMSRPERELFAQGFADEIVNTINRTGDRRNVVTRIFDSRDARERIRLALGRRRANALQARLHVEGVMDLARGAVTGNSTTARQLMELGLMGGGFSAGAFGLADPGTSASLIATGLLLRGGRALRSGQEQRVMEEVARLLASGDPNAVNRAVQRIARSDALLERFRNFDAAIARAGGQQVAEEPNPSAGSGMQ